MLHSSDIFLVSSPIFSKLFEQCAYGFGLFNELFYLPSCFGRFQLFFLRSFVIYSLSYMSYVHCGCAYVWSLHMHVIFFSLLRTFVLVELVVFNLLLTTIFD